MTPRGFPHSDTPGSKLVCSSPRLIAAYCVLHRLLAPRHSPYALSSLTIGMELTPAGFQRNRPGPIPLPRKPSLKNTAVFVDRKNYRLQDIQLSKITRGASLRRTPHRASLASRFVAPLRSRGARQTARQTHVALRSRGALAFACAKLARAQPTSAVRWLANRSCERSERSAKVGGEYRSRTGDLLVANQALSQLS